MLSACHSWPSCHGDRLSRYLRRGKCRAGGQAHARNRAIVRPSCFRQRRVLGLPAATPGMARPRCMDILSLFVAPSKDLLVSPKGLEIPFAKTAKNSRFFSKGLKMLVKRGHAGSLWLLCEVPGPALVHAGFVGFYGHRCFGPFEGRPGNAIPLCLLE